MEKLLAFLQTIPEYKLLLQKVLQGESAAVTGIGQINRAHLIAALRKDCKKPIVLICQDDMSAKRLQEELKAFLGDTLPILPSRELTLYDTAVVSRGWEQKRLRQFYELATGNCNMQIMSWEALSQRTVPPQVLVQTAFRLSVGQ